MNRLASILVLVSLWLPAFIFGQADDLRREIDKIIKYDTGLNYKKTPGFIVSVIDNDQTHHYSFGSKYADNTSILSSSDIFEIGSVSKVFTATAIHILINKGLINMTDKVNQHLPANFQNPRLEALTIADLIYHRSSLPKRPTYFGIKEKDSSNPYSHYKKSDLLQFYRDFIPRKRSFEYSHTNYAILELIIEKLTNKSYEDVVHDEIFTPLLMDGSFVDFPEKKENIITPGYDRSGKSTQAWTFSSFKASEGIKSNPADLVKFVNAFLNGQSAAYIIPKSNDAESFNKRLGINMGWQTIHMSDFDILTHTGKTTGHTAFIGMVRETKTAVIIMANSGEGTEDLGLQILRMINYNWKRVKV